MAPTTPAVRVALLGPLEVEVDGRPVGVPTGHQRTTLVALALAGGTVSTDRLVTALWGDDPPPSAVNSLQSHVARLRRSLGSSDTVERQASGYRLVIEPDAVDARVFERLVDDAGHEDDPGARRVLLDRALDLWRADTAEEVIEAGLVEHATSLAQRRLSALAGRAEAALANGDLATAESDLRTVLQADPLREPAIVGLVRVLAADGRTAEADGIVQQYRERLAEELGLDPSPALLEVHTRLLRGELHAPATTTTPEAAAPMTPVAARARQQLPRPRSSFHGRTQLLADLVASVPRTACTTLVGPGGVGKTRTALELAHRLDATVLWADLVDTRSTADVLGRLALAAGTGTPPGIEDLGALTDAVAGSDVVLVLDNCEQVRDHVAAVVDALLVAADVHVVATSRTPLHVDGEYLVELRPLPTVATAGGPAPALAVLVDRAGGAIDPADDAQREHAAEVARALDGLPLALELAARQVRNLGLDAVHARLGQRLELLRAGRPPDHPAHADLRMLVRWSTDQLDPVEQRVFRWLAVFAGPFTLDQAEAVLADEAAPRSAVAGALARLVEQSLVVQEEPGRFRLLETLRVCAAEDLDAAGDGDAARRCHTAAILAAAEDADARLMTPAESEALAELHAIVADLQAVSARLCDGDDLESLCRLGRALHRYAYDRQRLMLLDCARVAADRLDAEAGEDLDPDLVVGVRAAAAVQAASAADVDRAHRLATAATSPDRPTVAGAVAWDVLGDARLSFGDPAAEEAFARVVALGEQLEVPWLVAQGHIGVGLVHAYTGDHAGALAIADILEPLADELAIPSMQAWAAYVRGEAEAGFDADAAVTAFETAIRLARGVDCHLAVLAASSGLAAVRAHHGDPRSTLQQLRDTLEGQRRSGRSAVRQTVLRHLGVLLARVAHDRPAAMLLGAGVVGDLYEAERRRLQVALESVTERLGAETADELREAGARMPPAELVELALAAVADVLDA